MVKKVNTKTLEDEFGSDLEQAKITLRLDDDPIAAGITQYEEM